MTKMILDYRGYRLEYVVEGDRERVGIFKDGREVMTAQNVGRAKEWVRAQAPTVLGLHVIQFPSGRFGFVGSLPKELVAVKPCGGTLTDAEFAEYRQSSSPALISKIHGYKEPVFQTESEAWAYAAKFGYTKE